MKYILIPEEIISDIRDVAGSPFGWPHEDPLDACSSVYAALHTWVKYGTRVEGREPVVDLSKYYGEARREHS